MQQLENADPSNTTSIESTRCSTEITGARYSIELLKKLDEDEANPEKDLETLHAKVFCLK